LTLPVLILDGLPVKIGVVTMMTMVVHVHHNLSLRRIGHCKAEKEN
jgi:hypothetical protein